MTAALLSIGELASLLAADYPDVSISSLRFLEREGLVRPLRTPGGHRLYGPDEVARVRRIKDWQRSRLSLAEIRARLQAADRPLDTTPLRKEFLDAALAGESAAARGVVLDAFESGVPLARLNEEVLRPALYEIGDRWKAGHLAVSQEHEVTAIARDAVAELAARAQAAPPASSDREVVVAACVPGELHDLGLRMLAAQHQEHGHVVHFLGANVPVDSIVHAVRAWRPSELLLSLTLPERLPALAETISAVAALPEAERPRIFAGGQGVHGHEEEIRRLGADC